MDVLNDRELLNAIYNGEISISPLTFGNIQSTGIDLTLHPTLEISPGHGFAFDCSRQIQSRFRTHEITGDGYELKPGRFVVGFSTEELRIPSFLCGRIINCDGLAECGIDTRASALVEPYFRGRVSVVIRNFAGYSVMLQYL